MQLEHEKRRSTVDGHILISGTGRAGTTLLVRYFTALGFDTGFSTGEASRVDKISNAGLEFISAQEPLPYVIKSPLYAEILGECLDRRTLAIKYCIVPMRRLFDAAESRRRIYREAARAGLDPTGHPGSVWATSDLDNQESALALQLYGLIEALARHDIPTYFLHFPAFVESAGCLYGRLRPILDEHAVSEIESETAFKSVVDPSLPHVFSKPF